MIKTKFEHVPSKIETDRLVLTMLTPEDTDLMFELDQDEAVMKYINGGKKTTMEQVVNVFVPRLKQYHDPVKGHGLWKVTAKSPNNIAADLTNNYLGWVLVRPMYFFSENKQMDNLEMGWRFKQCTWGKGIATEAAKAVADMLSEQPSVNALSAIAEPDNQASINIMTKLGMTFLKREMYQDPLGNFDTVFYEKRLRG